MGHSGSVVERRTRGGKVVGSIPGKGGVNTFFSGIKISLTDCIFSFFVFVWLLLLLLLLLWLWLLLLLLLFVCLFVVVF